MSRFPCTWPDRSDEWRLLRSTLTLGDLVTAEEICDRMGIVRHSLNYRIRVGKFPPPIARLDHSRPVWLRSEADPMIDKYVKQRDARKHLKAWKAKYQKEGK